MACMTVPWAPVAALINSLPLSAAGMRDHGSSGTGGPGGAGRPLRRLADCKVTCRGIR
jgi:hypothetical protein